VLGPAAAGAGSWCEDGGMKLQRVALVVLAVPAGVICVALYVRAIYAVCLLLGFDDGISGAVAILSLLGLIMPAIFCVLTWAEDGKWPSSARWFGLE